MKVLTHRKLEFFYYFVIIEVFLLGSGQDFHVFGPLTLRMLNFLMALISITILSINKKVLSKDDFTLLLVYLIVLY